MTSLSSWVAHFKRMSEGKLPPGSLHIVKTRGGGPSKTYYRVISPVQQTIDQAEAKLKIVNRGHVKPGRKVQTRKGRGPLKKRGPNKKTGPIKRRPIKKRTPIKTPVKRKKLVDWCNIG